MTGREAAQLREAKGYTQGALAKALQMSGAPAVCRREELPEVPADFAEALRRLPPAPEGTPRPRGTYRAPAKVVRVAPRRSPVQTRAAAVPEHNQVVTEESKPAVPESGQVAEYEVYEPGELEEVSVEALVLGLLLLEGVRREVVRRALGEEVDRAFALVVLEDATHHAQPMPPPLPWRPRAPIQRRCPRCLR